MNSTELQLPATRFEWSDQDTWFMNWMWSLSFPDECPDIEIRETRNDRCNSTFGEMLTLDMAKGFPILTCKRVPFYASVGETLAFLSGATNNEDFLKMGCRFWTPNSEDPDWLRNPNHEGPGDLGRIYGAQWRTWRGFDRRPGQGAGRVSVDQIQNLLEGLRKSPYSRRHIVSAWNPAELDQMALPPCHVLFQVYAHTDGGLSLLMFQRSADLFLGVPFNITSYALILHILAAMTGRTPRKLKMVFGDLHLYHQHIAEGVSDQLSKSVEAGGPYELPVLHIAPNVLNEQSDFKEMGWADPKNFTLLGYKSGPTIPATMVV